MLQCFTMLILCQEYRLSLPLLMPSLFPAMRQLSCGPQSSTSYACASMLARLSRARSNATLPETRNSQKGKRQGGTQEGKLLHLEVTQSVPPALEGHLAHRTSVHVVRTVVLYSATKRLETCVNVFCLCKCLAFRDFAAGLDTIAAATRESKRTFTNVRHALKRSEDGSVALVPACNGSVDLGASSCKTRYCEPYASGTPLQAQPLLAIQIALRGAVQQSPFMRGNSVAVTAWNEAQLRAIYGRHPQRLMAKDSTSTH
jgi:hypothetical protein